MDNKNAAPENYPPLGRLLPMMRERHCAMCGKSIPIGNRHYSDGDKPACVLGPEPEENHATLLQPVSSESDGRQGVPEVWPDDVLTDMDNAWRKATDVRRVGHYETLMAVAAAAIRGLARHRAPVTAPYGAEGLRMGLDSSRVAFEHILKHAEAGTAIKAIAEDGLKYATQQLAQSPTIQAEGK